MQISHHCNIMIRNSNIIVLILSTKNPIYNKFKLVIQNTWMKDFEKNGVKCFFYEGESDNNEIDGNTIKVNAPDCIYGVSEKLVETLKYIFEVYPETQIIYRTNLSSYIDFETFMKFLKFHKINENSYVGLVGNANYFKEMFYKKKVLYYLMSFFYFGKKIKFASGAGFFLGATHCIKIITSRVNLNLIDDIMVADTIKIAPDERINPIRLSIDDDSKHKFTNDELDELINSKMLFHYRFKTNSRSEDAELLNKFGSEQYRNYYLLSQDQNMH